jgi:site-specific DNA-methyltransferase (adenine-specific)
MNNPWKRKEVIGDQTLYLGDCMEVMPKLGKVDAVVTDPPYELSDSDPGKYHFGMSLSKFDDDAYKNIVSGVDYAALFDKFSASQEIPNGFVFCSNKQVSKLMGVCENKRYSTTLLVWHKTNAAPFANGVWRGDIEYIVHFRGKGAVFNGGAIDKTKVLPHPIVIDSAHPTVKPQPIIQRLIKNCSNQSGIVLDPFMGSGTTLVACAKLGRSGIGIELDPDYFNIACERVEKAYQQTDLFVAPPENKDIKRNQVSMFDDGDAA